MTRIAWRLVSMLAAAALALMLTLVLSPDSAGDGGPPAPKRDPQIGQSFRVPYRLTDTNHFLVRARINGKGPFNFLVDSGAPALFISTETAKKIGLKPDPDAFWTAVERLDLEGGSQLKGLKARVEDPFQLVGMNALGLPGASIDGILGFTILARFRLEIDLTKDRMIWIRLDHDPQDPPVPDHKPGEKVGAPAGVQAMSMLGPLAKGLAFLMGKQPEEQHQPRGCLGLEWSEQVTSGRKHVLVQGVLEGLPAARGGVRVGDQIVAINDRVIKGLKEARTALSEVHSGDPVPLVVRRGSGNDARDMKLTLTAGEGL
jgi:serine protease Do